MSQDEYKSTAPFYDRVLTPMLKTLRKDICTYINYRGYHSVIDICCGTGDQLQMLQRPSMNLVGIDNSAAMLAYARNRCSEHVALHLLDAEQLQPPEEPFDCALLVFSLHEKHPTTRDRLFANARQMVRQGGTLIIADYSHAIEGMQGKVVSSLVTPVIERCAGKEHYRNYQDWRTRGALEGFLDRHGLAVDVISRPYAQTVLCCAHVVNDDKEEFGRRIALLNQSLETAAAHTE